MTFMDDYWAGYVDDVKPYVEDWRRTQQYGRPSLRLREYLGMTDTEYDRWVETGKLPERGAP